jgi:hypothetical protein
LAKSLDLSSPTSRLEDSETGDNQSKQTFIKMLKPELEIPSKWREDNKICKDYVTLRRMHKESDGILQNNV